MAPEPDINSTSVCARIISVARFPLVILQELFLDDVPALAIHLLQRYFRSIKIAAMISLWSLSALFFNLYILATRTLGWLFIAFQIVAAAGLVYVASWLAQVLVMLALEYPVVLIPLAVLGYVAPLMEEGANSAFYWVYKQYLKRFKEESKEDSRAVKLREKGMRKRRRGKKAGKYLDVGVQTELAVSVGRTAGEDEVISSSGKDSRARSHSF